MWYGRTGVDLEIDLSRGNIERKEGDPKEFEHFLGGKGINSKMAWDRLPPELDPFSPDNLLIFGAGVLDGTIAPSANRTTVTTKAPQWKFLINSSVGGFWGPALKKAGYDTISFTGKSSAPVYVWIDNDKIEIRDASHLWGKDTFETQRIIREELKNDKVEILCIGQAGENRVYMATIEQRGGASASRGVAAIMGSKNLKAVAVYGTKDVYVANPSKFYELCDQILKRSEKVRDFVDQYTYSITQFVYNRFVYFDGVKVSEGEYDWPVMHTDFNKEYETRRIACCNCAVRCKSVISLPRKKSFFAKCQSLYSYQLLGHTDWSNGMDFWKVCEGYGLDTFSLPPVLALAADLYQKGVLTKEDTGGLHLEVNNMEAYAELLKKVVYRQGIGDILANGSDEACRHFLGKDAEDYPLVLVKGCEQIPGSFYVPHNAFQAAISERGDQSRIMQWYNSLLCYFFPKGVDREDLEALYPGYKKEDFDTPYHPYPKVDKEEYIKEGYFNYPEEFKKWFLDESIGGNYAGDHWESMIHFIEFSEHITTMSDITGLCFFWTGFYLFPPVSEVGTTSVGVMAKLVSHATGLDVDENEALKICRRVENIVKAYNLRAGLRREDDKVPKQYFEKDPKPPLVRLDRKKWDMWLDKYYKLKKWNKKSVPTKEVLNELDLGYVQEELKRRGILE
jgi:aldehyde:ferredoxin oxidoreductase